MPRDAKFGALNITVSCVVYEIPSSVFSAPSAAGLPRSTSTLFRRTFTLGSFVGSRQFKNVIDV